VNTKGKILIVDDAELNRSVLADILGEKYEIIEAENGLEAIVQIEKNKHELSLVLLDIMMPKVDGFEVLAIMNKNKWLEQIPVIIISSETPRPILKMLMI
jgi:diguanylate cyclase and metal dependent phosphohydrolase